MTEPLRVEVEVLHLSKLSADGMKALVTKVGDLSNRVYTFSLGLVDAEEIMHWLSAHPESEDPIILEIEPRLLIPVIQSWSAAHEPVSPTTRN